VQPKIDFGEIFMFLEIMPCKYIRFTVPYPYFSGNIFIHILVIKMFFVLKMVWKFNSFLFLDEEQQSSVALFFNSVSLCRIRIENSHLLWFYGLFIPSEHRND